MGGEFQPQTNLGLTQKQMIAEAANLTSQLGDNVVLMHAVAESARRQINTSMLPELHNYVSGLRSSGAEYVSGWLDLKYTNVTSPSNIYTQVAMMVQSIGVNAIWLDHAVGYWDAYCTAHAPNNPRNCIEDPTFNTMMQNLHNLFPSVLFFLNVSPKNSIITPAAGTSWAAKTYVLPDNAIGSTTKWQPASPSQVGQYNTYFPGHVVLHFDSQAKTETEPMWQFASINATAEASAINLLLCNGLEKSTNVTGYNLLVPIIGGNTYLHSAQRGLLYNSLGYGSFAKNTVGSFVALLQKYDSKNQQQC
ncbi:MAG: hypothetical protein OK456_08660 [Thaumarchaeota archaeon]|nr:hypothetical protein [Nitrososphaerota archaeon]